MKINFLLVALVAFSTTLSAQDWSADVYKFGEQYPGYIITDTGVKIEGFIKYRDPVSMQEDVMFFAEKGNRKSKVKYKTADLKEYKVADKLYHCIHYSGGLMKKPVRANLVVNEGCITEYVWYAKVEGFALLTRGTNESIEDYYKRCYDSTMVFKKQNEEEVKALSSFGIKFAPKMAEYVADNKELAQKVKGKEKGYKALGILNIIAEYNAACTPK